MARFSAVVAVGTVLGGAPNVSLPWNDAKDKCVLAEAAVDDGNAALPGPGVGTEGECDSGLRQRR